MIGQCLQYVGSLFAKARLYGRAFLSFEKERFLRISAYADGRLLLDCAGFAALATCYRKGILPLDITRDF